MRKHVLAVSSALAFALALSACGDARPLGEGTGGTALLECTSCHGTPPPPPHPPAGDCFDCHSATVDAETRIIPGGGHMNGQTDFALQGDTSCTACHGYPPAAPHPQDADCSGCHGDTVRADDQTLIPPAEGGAHMNGNVDGGGHEPGFLAVHGLVANANIASCTECHGADYNGGIGTSCTSCHGGIGFASWQTNCTFCHGQRTPAFAGDLRQAAPPQSVRGEEATTAPGVGAHQKHLGNGSVLTNGFTCEACHTVPTDLSHVNGTARAELNFGTLATTGGLVPTYDGARCSNVYCHGGNLVGGTVRQPTWTTPPAQLCGSCHGRPPNTNLHVFHVVERGLDCGTCHAGYTFTSTNPATHVNGTRNVVFRGTTLSGWGDPLATPFCNECHSLR